MKRIRPFILAALVTLALPALAQACPFCNDSQNAGLAQGVYLSILFMLGMIIVLPTVLVGAFWYSLKKHGPRGLNDTSRAAAEPPLSQLGTPSARERVPSASEAGEGARELAGLR